MKFKKAGALSLIGLLAMLMSVADAATSRGVNESRKGKLDPILWRLSEEAGVLARTQEARSSILQQTAGYLARVNHEGAVQVYVHSHQGFPLIEPVLNAAGLQVELVNTRLGVAKGWVDPARLGELSQLSSVKRITTPDYAFTRTGSVNTEGDALLRAQDLRTVIPGYTGAGVRVGVISDGITGRAAAQATGDLPALIPDFSTTICDPILTGSACAEGTAMLEIIYDLAPGADLGFCGPGDSIEFMQCVDDLQNIFMADIIVDDLGFLLEPYFEDGGAADAVRTAATTGVDYVSAAGNSAAGHYYESDLVAGPPFVVGPDAYLAQHNFGAGDFTQSFILPDGETLVAVLQWSNPFDGTATDDYDVILFDNADTPLGIPGNFIQDGVGGDDFPVEITVYENLTGADQVVQLRVLQFSAGTPHFKLVARSDGEPFEYSTAIGSIFGHPAVPEAIAVGSINVFEPGLDTIASYSSRGPVRIDFPPAAGMRPKPDITGVDCGSITGAGGFGQTIGGLPNTRFCGTSAAAPHVAGVLALLKSIDPGNAATEMRNTADDRGAVGFDNIYGFGLVNAVAAAQNLVLLASIDSPAADSIVTIGASVTFAGTCNDAPPPAVPDPFAINWNFDGGTTPNTDTMEDPGARTFDTLGDFTVTLTCTNANGTSTAQRIISVISSGGPAPGGGSSSGGGGGGCFIATAAYGSYLHPRVQVLRDFRDEYLMTHVPGRAFVQWYYHVSPPMADIIANNEMLRLMARGVLTPVVYVVQYPGLGAGLLLLGFMGLRGYRRVLRPETSH